MDRHADSAPVAGPTAEHYHLLRRLRRLLHRSDSACLIFLWCDDPRPLAWLRAQLDRSLRARSLRMLDHALLAGPAGTTSDIETALSPVLAALLKPEPGADRMAVWVDLGHDPAGRSCRDWLLARLNERRAPLMQASRAVVLAGPAVYEAQAAEVAPDLWSVRDFSTLVPVWVTGDSPSAASMPLPEPTPSDALGQLWVAAWARHEARLAEEDASSRLDLSLGFSVVTEALRHRQLARARQVLEQTAAALPTGDETGAGLRLSAQQLTLEGDLAMQERQLSLARQRYEQGLRVSERLVKVTGESPEALRDWWVSLIKVGDVQSSLGSLEEARQRYEQGLRVSERLVKVTGESPEALRDWSISLERLGDVQRWLGSLEEARQRYEQGLRVRERLVKVTGESPQALFDLACSVERVGVLHQQAGDAPAARACFEREVWLAEMALRQSPLSVEFQNLLANARARLAATLPDTP